MSLKYEPASEPQHIYVEWLFLRPMEEVDGDAAAEQQPLAHNDDQVKLLLLLYSRYKS